MTANCHEKNVARIMKRICQYFNKGTRQCPLLSSTLDFINILMKLRRRLGSSKLVKELRSIEVYEVHTNLAMNESTFFLTSAIIA